MSTSRSGEDPAPEVAALVASANAILDRTPDPQWWDMRPRELVAFAFPDWGIVAAVDNDTRIYTHTPRVLLRHRTTEDRWLLIWCLGRFLLPGRASTMGQFFRFRHGWGRNEYATGTLAEIESVVEKRFHALAAEPLVDWLRAATADPLGALPA